MNSLVKCVEKKKRTFKIASVDIIQDSSVKKNRSDAIGAARSFIRHDSQKLARVLVGLMGVQLSPSTLRIQPRKITSAVL
jgi:hypothetical protein